MLRGMDREKLSFNLSAAELGQIEVLIANGLYTSKTDVIRAALRQLFATHADVVARTLAEASAGQPPGDGKVIIGSIGTGSLRMTAEQLQQARARGERVSMHVIGVATVDDDISPELAAQSVARINVFGVLRGPTATLDAIADRIMHNGRRRSG
jgi:Arc/MetJ-type ribon-helix-helix transcriptional regulator